MRYLHICNFTFLVMLSPGCRDDAPALADAGGALGGGPNGVVVIWPAVEEDATERIASVDADNPWLSMNADIQPSAEPGSSSQSGTGGAVGVVSDSTPVAAQPGEVRIRAYLETTSARKALLIENVGQDMAVGCQVRIFSNGGTEPWRSYEITDVAPSERVLLCVPDAFSEVCDQVHSGSSFNGDDAISVECAGETVDHVGDIGVDPGTAWEGIGLDGRLLSTKDAGVWLCSDGGLELGDPEPTFGLGAFVAWDWLPAQPWVEPMCPSLPNQSGGGAGGNAGG